MDADLINKNIGILMGGPSEEREISNISGKAVSRSLSEGGFNVKELVIPESKGRDTEFFKKEVYDLLKESEINIAFIALHGWFGEDGQIQQILESLNIPYTGSCSQSCRKAFNKFNSKIQFMENNIPVAEYKVLKKFEHYNIDNIILPGKKFPVVVKPVCQGSSIGLTVACDFNQLKAGIKSAFEYGDMILLEEYLEGKELTVGVLDSGCLPVIEVVPKEFFYNFKAKYEDSLTEYIVPAVIPDELEKELYSISFKAFKVLGCSGMGRVDIKLDSEGYPKVLELNTIPGLTSKSLLPKAALNKGIDFLTLCKIILKSAKPVKEENYV